MGASIGNTKFGINSSGVISFDNDGHTIVVFLCSSGASYTVSNVAYGGQSMAQVNTRAADCRIYGFVLENAPSGINNLTVNYSSGAWYYAIYAIVDGGAVGDNNTGGVSQKREVHAIISTQDANSIVVTAIVRRFYASNVLYAHNMTEDDERLYSDGRCAAGHTPGTGGNVDPYWSWNSTENAACSVIEILEREAPEAVSISQAVWFF